MKKPIRVFAYLLIAALVLPGGQSRLPSAAAAQSSGTARMQVQPASPAHEIPDKVAIFDPSKKWPHLLSELPPDPNAIYGSLDNGFRYVVMKNKKPENRVSMHLYVQAGSMHETDEQRGLAHYLEHMLFNGSEHFKPGELVKYFQSIGMQFGADANASTGFYKTVYDIDLPSGDPDSLAKGMLVLHDYAAGALILEKEVEKERPIVLAEKRTRDSVDYRTFEAVFNFEMPNALLSSRLPIGTEEVLAKADRPLLKSFYDTWYRPERMVIVMVGDFDPQKAVSMIRERFSDIKARAPLSPYNDPGSIHHEGTQSFYHYEPEAGNTSVVIEVITKKVIPPDSKTLEKTNLYSAMANRIINNRLEEMLDKPETPFSDANISSGNYLGYVLSSDISADCAPENWKAAMGAIDREIRSAIQYGFTESELAEVKKDFVASLEKAVLTAPTRESRQLAREIMNGLNQIRVFQSPEQEKKLLLPIVQTATAEALHQALMDYWKMDQRLVLVTGNADLRKESPAPEQQILSAFKQSQETEVAKPEERGNIKFPYLAVPKTPTVAPRIERVEDLGITVVEFGNGVRLNVKKTDFKANQVVAALAFGGGQASEPLDKPGLSELSASVVNLSGLGKLTRDELKRALAGKNTYTFFKVEENKFVFTGNTIPDEIGLLFDLLYAHMQDPAFRSDAYSLSMKQFAQKYESLMHEIYGGMVFEGARFLAGGDPRFGLPDFKTFRKNSLSDIRDWLTPAIESAPLELSIVGDIDVQRVIDLATTYFGTLPARSGKITAHTVRMPNFPETEKLNVRVPTKIYKGIVDVTYPTDDFWNISTTRRLSVLSSVMSDRMRIRIREKMGAAYSYEAYNDPSLAYPGYGVYHALAQINPDRADEVIAAIREIAADLAQTGVTQEELQRALKPIVEGIRERIKTNGYWLDSVLKGSGDHPERFDWARTFLSDYASINADELGKMAKVYLNNAAAATIRIIPEEQTANSAAPPAETEPAAQAETVN